jgi:succinate-semialdehyde dehydrogenase/glutarate-semialdehyde dehydrogenase
MTTTPIQTSREGLPPYRELSLYIDGTFISAQDRQTIDVLNPASSEVLGKLPVATTADLDHALASAERAFQSWRKSSPLDRSAILRRVATCRERAHDIARDLTRDQGKPLEEALSEILRCAEHAEWHAEECRRIYGRVIPPREPGIRQMVVREPVGVCAAFTPWISPSTRPSERSLPPWARVVRWS